MNKVANGKKYWRKVLHLMGEGGMHFKWKKLGESGGNEHKSSENNQMDYKMYICTSNQKRNGERTFISGNGWFFYEQLEMLKRIKCTIKNVVLFILHLPNGHVRFAGSDQTQSVIDSEEIFTIRQLIGHKRCVAIWQ